MEMAQIREHGNGSCSCRAWILSWPESPCFVEGTRAVEGMGTTGMRLAATPGAEPYGVPESQFFYSSKFCPF